MGEADGSTQVDDALTAETVAPSLRHWCSDGVANVAQLCVASAADRAGRESTAAALVRGDGRA